MSDVVWKQVTVQVPRQMLDAVSDFLVTLTGRGVCTREENGAQLIDTWLSPEGAEDQTARIRSYLDSITAHNSLDSEMNIQVAEIPEDDWMSVFRSQHGPVHISDRLVVRPTWCEPVGENDLVIDPGMAFGTGSHFTTRMCLELLDTLPPHTGFSRMLDLGTGSGILAIAGAFLGMSEIIAIDIDPVAVEVASANVRDNGMDGIINLVEGGIEKAMGVYDVVTANLSGSLLVELADEISSRLETGGQLIASGIMEKEKEDVIASFTRCGLEPLRIVEDDEWVAVLFRRTI